MFVDRFLHTAMYYPGNYGFVPHTLSGDGDPVDVLVVGRVPVMPGAVMRSRPVGVLVMEDEAGEDEKILAVPVDKLHPYFTDVASYQDLPQILLDQVSHFFSHYKDLEKGKWSRILRWGGPEEAGAMIMAGVARARERGDDIPSADPDKAQASILKKPAPESAPAREPVLEPVTDAPPKPTEEDGAPLVTKWTSKLFGRGESEEDRPQPIEETAAPKPVAKPKPEPEAMPEPAAEAEAPRVDPIVAAGLAPEPDPAVEINGRVEILVGDMTKLKVDVIANSANERLRSSGGVDGAIHRAAGPDLQKACNELGGCPTGMCKMTDAFDLPAKAVIHCVGPVWHGGERGEEGLLRAATARPWNWRPRRAWPRSPSRRSAPASTISRPISRRRSPAGSPRSSWPTTCRWTGSSSSASIRRPRNTTRARSPNSPEGPTAHRSGTPPHEGALSA